jgi:DNA primase
MIPDHVIDEVRDRADIVEIIGEAVQLKKAGREFKANCPFHEERTPSFYVVPHKGFYKCFGCGKAGSVFDFVMERQGMDFVEAVKYVAGRAGVEVTEVHGRKPEEDPNRPYYEITAFAQVWFREQLLDDAVGRDAREYLEGRGIDGEVAERFELGFAPDEWRAFREAALKHGFEEDLMLELGLLKQSERSKEPYDGFRGRVMFPIKGVSGRVIAFGGRILETTSGDGPKYINSPETPIYQKGRNLYGLSRAKGSIRREKEALVVEGYMDAVSIAAVGFENVVAPLGTALTPEQALLISRYAKRVLLLYDSDGAGLKATFKAGDILLEAGVHPSVVTFPEGEDPDTYVRAHGADEMKKLLRHSIDIIERKLQILEQKNYFSSIDRRRSAVDRLLPTLRAVVDPTLRDLYVDRVSKETGVQPTTLLEDMKKASRPGVGGSPGGASSRAPAPPPPRPRSLRGGAERHLLKVMVRGIEWVERAAEVISREDFDDPYHRAIFEVLLDDPETRAPPPSMDPVAAQRFHEILVDPAELAHGTEIFSKAVTRIRVAALHRRAQDLQARIEKARSEERKLELVGEKARLAAEIRELDENYWVTATRRRPDDQNPNEATR